jgi:ribosomal protein S18 acetylase RimI-like enzyme
VRYLLGIVVREATQEDYAALCAIIEEVDRMHREMLPRRFKASEGPARSRSYIVNALGALDVGLFVAEEEGELMGLVHVIVRDVPEVPIFVPRRYAFVENVTVRGAHRRRGIGRALMRKAEAWARTKGATSIELSVYAFNRAAQAFYRRLGYETLSHHMLRMIDGTEPGREH